jgi:hypothetical protein
MRFFRQRAPAHPWREFKSLVVQEIIDDGYHTTLAHEVLGNVVWAVKRGRLHTFIACYLIEYRKGNGWKFEEVRESATPNEYGCPLQFFQMAPVANEAWRKEARARQASSARSFELRAEPYSVTQGSQQ